MVMALALANRATQIVGVPFAISSERDVNRPVSQMNVEGHSYDAFIMQGSKESDLVQKIRLGLIK